MSGALTQPPTSVGGLSVIDCWSATGLRWEYAVVRHPDAGPVVYQNSGAGWERVHASHANNLARRVAELAGQSTSEFPKPKKRGRPRKAPQEDAA